MPVITRSIQIQTRGNVDVIDITSKIGDLIKDSPLNSGIATIFVPGSTAAVTTIEYEPGLVKDLSTALERIAPSNAEYAHNLRWGDANGHSHIRACLMGPSLTVPFSNKQLLLGTWQQIVLVDLDNRPRSRRIILQLLGE